MLSSTATSTAVHRVQVAGPDGSDAARVAGPGAVNMQSIFFKDHIILRILIPVQEIYNTTVYNCVIINASILIVFWPVIAATAVMWTAGLNQLARHLAAYAGACSRQLAYISPTAKRAVYYTTVILSTLLYG